MAKKDFKEFICRPYCMFFQDGQKEEMTCQGAKVVESLVHSRQIRTDTIRSLTKISQLWTKHKELLERCVCRYCEFLAEGCDFQSTSPSEDLEPCGGYIVLAFLKENNLVDERILEAAQ